MSILDSHKSYYNQLHIHYLNELTIINEKTDRELQVEKDADKRKAIKEKRDNSKNVLTKKFEETVGVVCRVYDKYLTENLPQPSVIQVKLKIKILRKGQKFDGLVLKPTDE
jgi:hypothetical protein